jgi:hypothetical protein
LDRSLPESEDLNSASNGQGSDPSCGKSSATTTPRASSKSTGPTLPGFETCESATACQPLTSSAAAFLAKTSVWRGGVRALRALARGCGRSSHESLARWDRDTCSWRTSQASFLPTEGPPLAPFSGTWPRSGTMLGGTVYPLRPLAPLTDVIACLSWPTVPTPAGQEPGIDASRLVDRDGNPPAHLNQRTYDRDTGRLAQKWLTQYAQMWPTPRAGQEAEGRGDLLGAVKGWPAAKHHGRQTWPTPNRMDGERGPDARDRPGSGGPNLSSAVGGGQLNPEWVTWLMGFPPGWADVGEPNPTCPE